SLTGLRQRTPLQIVGFTHGVSVPNSRKLSSALKNPASVGGQLPNLGSLARQIRDLGLAGEDAVIAMARELGLQRLRAASRGRLEKALATSVEPERS
ncbi:MAG: hypothetical protein ACK5Y8_01445, partial [Betaproteobacteria bacterium]|nr:hypothetical protein [Rubrivivax sp.]